MVLCDTVPRGEASDRRECRVNFWAFNVYIPKIKDVIMVVLSAVITKEEDMFIAECPEVGTASQGFTIDEAVANLKEATELYLEEFPLKETMHPLLTTFEVAQVVRA